MTFARFILIRIVFAMMTGLALAALLSCADYVARDAVVPIEAPAAVDARDLRHQQTTAELQAAIAATTGRLATEAESRARVEQSAIDERFDQLKRDEAHRAELAAIAADERHLRYWAALGAALSVVAAVGLRLAGLPAQVSIALPAALASGCAMLFVWPTIAAALTLTVRYVLIICGCALALTALTVLGLLVRQLFREWHDYANSLRIAMPDAADAADIASRARQPALIRWLIDLLHPKASKL